MRVVLEVDRDTLSGRIGRIKRTNERTAPRGPRAAMLQHQRTHFEG